MLDVDAATDSLTDTMLWENAARVAGGYLVPVIAAGFVNSRIGLPDEAYGLIGVGAHAAMGLDMMAVGSGVYTVDALAKRTGIKDDATSLGV